MRRRDVLALVGATTLRPLAVLAQHKATPVIGWLTGTSFGPNPTAGPIHQGLSDVGYIESQNLAADLVSRKVDLIIAIGGPGPVLAAKRATSTIPILFVWCRRPTRARPRRQSRPAGWQHNGFQRCQHRTDA
jgi:putative tryptophan/tyrosine transport system substrate-binding protein